ncbi:MAG: RIP metalloprotease RseP [Candidatus Eisenbacteria bacterium]
MFFDVILPGVLLLGILVFLHEAGHFVVAKMLKVPVYRFSLGFGPALLRVRRGETTYQVSALPLGGYVSMAEERKNADGQDELVDRFSEQPWWKRVVIALAGPGANFITGFLALIVTSLVGVSVPDYDAVLGPIPVSAPATHYGLVEGARIAAVEGEAVTSFQDMLARAGQVPASQPLKLSVVSPAGPVAAVTVPAAERAKVFDDLVPPEADAVIGSVVVGTPAYLSGLQVGDRVLAIDGRPVVRWRSLTEVVSRSPGKTLDFLVARGDREFHAPITPQGPPTPDAWVGGRIGVEAPRGRTYLVRSTFGEALSTAFPMSMAISRQTFEGLFAVITRPVQSASSLGGPQMIMQIAGANAKRGTGDFIYILAVISFAIMAFNLLPLPVLDGGHVFLAAIEAIRRRPPSEWFTMVYQRIGLVLIGGFFVFVLYNDLSRSLQHRAAVQRNSHAPQGQVSPAR